jgi:hypothetical protein
MSEQARRWLGLLLFASAWLAVTLLVLLLPASSAETRVQWTASAALVWGIFACGWMVNSSPWTATPARAAWTFAWLAYLVHVAAAFSLVHGWSHAEAVAHVERRSGFGPGIWLSYLFTLLWTADVSWWWLSPASRASRPRWLAWLLYGYMGFITFNATVVFGETTRFQGALLFLVVAISGLMRLCRAPAPFEPVPPGRVASASCLNEDTGRK